MAALTNNMALKVGDKVRVRVSQDTRKELHGLEGVVARISYGGTVSVVLHGHTISGFPPDYEWGFGTAHLSDRLELTSSSPSAPMERQEKPCQTCRRPNDVGVKTCWMCGNFPG